MDRKKFIQSSLILAAMRAAVPSCAPKKKIKGSIVGASSTVGHLLRDKKFGTPAEQYKKKIVIVGGGVSGLSAAKYLYNNGEQDFLLLDLEKEVGGNAQHGQNKVSAYPWGAHYIPVPSNELTEYISFLKECGVVSEMAENGLPVYNDYYLCFDPEERYISTDVGRMDWYHTLVFRMKMQNR